MARHDPYDPHRPTGIPKDDRMIRTGVRGEQNRLSPFGFSFDDGTSRTFWGATEEQALEYAKTWGRGHGGLVVIAR